MQALEAHQPWTDPDREVIGDHCGPPPGDHLGGSPRRELDPIERVAVALTRAASRIERALIAAPASSLPAVAQQIADDLTAELQAARLLPAAAVSSAT